MRKNHIERAEKFHLGKGDKCRRGPLIKSSCFTVIFFRALSLTLPFHYLCSSKRRKKKEKTPPLLYLVAISSFPLHRPYSSRERERERERKRERKRERERNLPSFFFFGQSPCSCWSEKRSAWMSNCPQNTMKD